MSKPLTPQRSSFLIIMACVAIAAVIAIHGYILISTPANKHDDTLRTVVVLKGVTFGDIADELVAKGIIVRTKGFRLAGKLVGAEKRSTPASTNSRPR